MDEVGSEHATSVFMRTTQVRQAAALIGTLSSAPLARFALNVPVLTGALLTIGLALWLVYVMPETGFTPVAREERNSFGAMVETFREGVYAIRSSSLLRWFLLTGAVIGAYSESWDRLGDAFFVNVIGFPHTWGLQPSDWFGILSAGGQLLSLVAVSSTNRWLRVRTDAGALRVLLVLNGTLVAAVLAFGLSVSFPLAVISGWVAGMARTVSGPVFDGWISRNVESKARATVLSVVSQSDAIGQFAGGPILGAVGTRYGLRVAMVATSLALTPVFGFYARAFRGGRLRKETGILAVSMPED